jgi:hypothetical protein
VNAPEASDNWAVKTLPAVKVPVVVNGTLNAVLGQSVVLGNAPTVIVLLDATKVTLSGLLATLPQALVTTT